MGILGDVFDAAFNKMLDPNAKWNPSPMMAREDALRVGQQLLAGKSITVNGEVFTPVVKTWQPTQDKDLYFVLFTVDDTRSIEMALYKGADRSEFNYCVGGPEVKKGVKVETVIDADGNPVQLT